MSAPLYSVRVEVQSRYLPEQSEPDAGQYAFAYTIRITNTGSVASQLISRHWLIDDDSGRRVEVKGLGVLAPVSYTHLTLPKLAAVRARIDAHVAAGGQPIWLEVDGGIKVDNIAQVARAGADTFVAGSAVFGAPDANGGYRDVISRFRAALGAEKRPGGTEKGK